MTHSRPYTIVAPDYQITSGGIRVCYALRSWLEIKGQIAFVNGVPQTKDFIAIYPEIYHGNPAGADHVVRYILNTPGMMTTRGVPGPTVFDSTDKIYYFSKLYGGNEENTMFLPVLNLHIFKVTNRGKRTEKCKLIGKGKDLHLPETEGLYEITREFANDQAKLAEYLNECEVMYSYDPNSAMFEIARLCGCRVCIIPSFFTKEQFSTYEPGMNGISWGVDDEARLSWGTFRDHYINLIKTFDQRLERFIEETQHE